MNGKRMEHYSCEAITGKSNTVSRVIFISLVILGLSCASSNRYRIKKQVIESNHRIEYRFKKGEHKLFAHDTVLYSVKLDASADIITPLEVSIGDFKLHLDTFERNDFGAVMYESFAVTKRNLGDSIVHIRTKVDTFSIKLDSTYRRIVIYGGRRPPKVIVILSNFVGYD
ncbi:MAG: hypothetical protein ACYC1Q_04190 [Bacteroidia bacterium]